MANRLHGSLDRLFDLTGRDVPGVSASKLLSFGRLLRIVVAVEMWESIGYWLSGSYGAWHLAKGVAMTLCCVAGWRREWNRAACIAAGLLASVELIAGFPRSPNHHYVVVICAVLLALPGRGLPDERGLALAGLRWLAMIGLIWAGLQKAWYGFYFRGEFFACAMARNDRFAGFFSRIVSDAELERLRGLGIGPGVGPFRVDDTLFVLISNLAWIGELTLPLLLLVRRTRTIGIVATLGYITMIEIAAREIFFGGLMVGLVLLFARTDAVRRGLPWFIVLYAAALASLAGIVPSWTFT